MDLLEFHAFIVKQYKKTNYDEAIMKNLLVALMNKVLLLHQESGNKEESEPLTHREEIFQRFFEAIIHVLQKRKSNKILCGEIITHP